MCYINEGGDINEAEGKKEIKEGTLRLTGKGFFFFLKDGVTAFFAFAGYFFSFFYTFSLRLRSSRTLLTGGPAADGYGGLDLPIAAGTERVNINLMGGTV